MRDRGSIPCGCSSEGLFLSPQSHAARTVGGRRFVVAMSRRLAMVGFQQSAQTFDANDLALFPFMPRLDDSVEALVNPLVMIVLEILR